MMIHELIAIRKAEAMSHDVQNISFPAFIVPDDQFGGTKLVPHLLIQHHAGMSTNVDASAVLEMREENRRLRDALNITTNHRDRLQKIIADMAALLAKEASK
jgi:hypothetical protein